MAAEDHAADWAVVVGIQDYPGLSAAKLGGSVDDAKEFTKWLRAIGVPKVHIFEATSKPTLSKSTEHAVPPYQFVKNRFGEVVSAVDKNQQMTGGNAGVNLGRRLYIFLSGHGFEPAARQPALLTADARPIDMAHIAGRLFADWFSDAASFEEIILFMDCCRTVAGGVPLIACPFVKRAAVGNPPRRFSAFATLTANVAFETKGKKARGVFTAALLDGLRGKAAVNGVVTDRSLAFYLAERLQTLAADDEGKAQVPQLEPDPMHPIELTRVPVKTFDVTINVSNAMRGKPYIISGQFNVEVEHGVTKAQIKTKLESGKWFTLLIGGQPMKVLRVRGAALVENV